MSENAQMTDLLTGLPVAVQEQARAVERGKFLDERLRLAIIRLRGSGVSIRRVCESLGVHPKVVQAAELSDPELLSTGKERQATAWDLVQALAAEELAEKILRGEVKPGEMGLVGGIAGTKSAELRGEATVRVEVTHRVPTREEILDRMKRARVIDVDSESESDGKAQFHGQIGGSHGVSAGVSAGDLSSSPLGTPATVAGLGGGVAAGAVAGEGAGGGCAAAGGVRDTMGSAATKF